VHLRQKWVKLLCGCNERHLLLDTKLMPVVGQTCTKCRSDFTGEAAYDYCATWQLHYFGYKLVNLVTFDRLPVVYDLVPANFAERDATEAVLFRVQNCDIFADNSFIGQDWQAEGRCHSTNRIWTIKRINQAQQNPASFDALLKRLRECIESTFNQLSILCLERISCALHSIQLLGMAGSPYCP
jgi:hypothetical protein